MSVAPPGSCNRSSSSHPPTRRIGISCRTILVRSSRCPRLARRGPRDARARRRARARRSARPQARPPHVPRRRRPLRLRHAVGGDRARRGGVRGALRDAPRGSAPRGLRDHRDPRRHPPGMRVGMAQGGRRLCVERLVQASRRGSGARRGAHRVLVPASEPRGPGRPRARVRRRGAAVQRAVPRVRVRQGVRARPRVPAPTPLCIRCSARVSTPSWARSRGCGR